MIVVTFFDYVPQPRADGVAWTQARIDQSDSPDGPWTAIDSFTLSPLDADPLYPAPRTFTTHQATLEAGWYRVVFVDPAANEGPTAAIQRSGIPYMPALSDVGALLRARTKDSDGVEQGTFTTATRPTSEQAERLILDATDDVTTVTGEHLPENVWRQARSLIAIRAAMLIELSYWPEQVETNRSPYSSWERLYTPRLTALQMAVRESAAGERDPGAVSDPGTPSYNFDQPSAPAQDFGVDETMPPSLISPPSRMIGFGERW